MELNKFSVTMSVYKNDSAEHFDRALESITDLQTVKPHEIVLIVDGPVGDDIRAVIEKYTAKYDYFKVIEFQENRGLGNALRVALDNASYELVARMDSDDVAVADRFEQQLQYIQRFPEVDIVGGDITEFIGAEENIVSLRVLPVRDEDIKRYTKGRCPFNHMTTMFKKSKVIAAGNYQDWPWNEDYYLWIRMLMQNATFANTGTVLVNVRVGEEMYRRRGGWKYFKSEARLQRYMLKHKVVGHVTCFVNLLKRFIVQVCLPSKLRGFVFQKIARDTATSREREEKKNG